MIAWLHIRTSALTPQIIQAARTKHREKAPDCELSVTRNVANTEALVKIDGADPAWRNALPASVRAAIIRVYTEATHREIFDWFYSSEWQEPA